MAKGALAPIVPAPVPTPQRIDLHVFVHVDTPSAVEAKVDHALTLLGALLKLEVSMAGELDSLTAEVSRVKTVDDSVLALIAGINKRLDDAIAAGDPVKLAALAASLKENTDALAAAVVANTPVA